MARGWRRRRRALGRSPCRARLTRRWTSCGVMVYCGGRIAPSGVRLAGTSHSREGASVWHPRNHPTSAAPESTEILELCGLWFADLPPLGGLDDDYRRLVNELMRLML